MRERVLRRELRLSEGDYCQLQLVTQKSDKPAVELMYEGALRGGAQSSESQSFTVVSTTAQPLFSVRRSESKHLVLFMDPGMWLAAALAAPKAGTTPNFTQESLEDSLALVLLLPDAFSTPLGRSPHEQQKELAFNQPAANPVDNLDEGTRHFLQTPIVGVDRRTLRSRSPEDRIQILLGDAQSGAQFELEDSRLDMTFTVVFQESLKTLSVVPTALPAHHDVTVRVRDLRSARRWVSSPQGCEVSISRVRRLGTSASSPLVLEGEGNCLNHLRGRLLPSSGDGDGVLELPERFFFRLPL